MSELALATLRLGKDSVTDIKKISAAKPGIVLDEFNISVICTQVPAEFGASTVVFLWLGSDNNKGISTEWKQGFKALGTVQNIVRGHKYNDSSTIELSLKYIFSEAINRLDVLQKAPEAYYWCSALPIIGLDDHSNQTVRMIVSDSDRSDIKAFFYALNSVRPEFHKDIIKVYPDFKELFDYMIPNLNFVSVRDSLKGGRNVLLYGVPGSGKSYMVKHFYCNDAYGIERVVFHPDYTYGDFVGQILPVPYENGKIQYEFTPGPFTRIMYQAVQHPDKKYCLVIEEINRGNAPAIFGDIFQLLDRDENGSSSYEITNVDVAKIVFGNNNKGKIKIPANLFIFATMNTSDQNVFTLDTAFQRRWDMRMVENNVAESRIAKFSILDTDITWETFNNRINELILAKNVGMASSEDKRLGAYFVTASDLHFYTTEDGLDQKEADDKNHNFPEKVLKYLWDDAFKFVRDEVFKEEFDSLEKLIKAFETKNGNSRFDIFLDDIFNLSKAE